MIRTRAGRQTAFLIQFLSFLFLMIACGGSSGKKSSSNSRAGKIEKEFELAAKENNLPLRFVIAAALLESHINPSMSSVPYFGLNGEGEQKNIGFSLTETAFGITRQELGLTGDNSDDLATQIHAYAKWVRQKIDASGDALVTNPSKIEDKFWWVWQIAKLHRSGEDQTRAIRIIFAKSLINILNAGETWQDPVNNESLVLTPESPQLEESKFPPEGQALLRLSDMEDLSDISNAKRLQLTTDDYSTLRNKPIQIQVIHCPLSLSACLELQDSSVDTSVRLGAHYVIPQDNSVVARPLQIQDHERPVKVTGSDGVLKDVKNAVVVMLVGNSGRYVDGKRLNADPTWFTPWQLRKLGSVISSVCRFLSQRYTGVDYRTCTTPEVTNGVEFQNQGTRATYRWGEIPDYEKSIFWSYLKAGSANISGEAVLEFPKRTKTYKAGQWIEFVARFVPGIRHVRFQRAVRCDDDQVVWETMQVEYPLNITAVPFKIRIRDAGPNFNGRQFFRVLVSDENNVLAGWAIDDMFLTKYDTEYRPNAQACVDRDRG